MPASTSAIMKNVDRMADDTELMKLWNAAATDDRTPNQAWEQFLKAADAAHMADRVPGTVGRTFAKKYAFEPNPEPAKPVSSPMKPAATKRPTRSTTKAASSASSASSKATK